MGLWSNVGHNIGNRVPFGTGPYRLRMSQNPLGTEVNSMYISRCFNVIEMRVCPVRSHRWRWFSAIYSSNHSNVSTDKSSRLNRPVLLLDYVSDVVNRFCYLFLTQIVLMSAFQMKSKRRASVRVHEATAQFMCTIEFYSWIYKCTI